jgi:hypothetical protein
MEKPAGYLSVSITNKRARVGYAKQHGVPWFDLIIQDAVAADYLRIKVREEREWDGLPLGKGLQRGLVVIRNGVELDARCFEGGVNISQLTELRPARGSPNRRAEKYNDCRCVASVLVETD